MACHFPAVSVVPVVPVRPLENEIPCGRPSHWPALGLALSAARKRFCRARLRARTTGSPLARLWPVQGHKGLLLRQKALAKGPPAGLKIFFTFFHKPPCALSANVVHLRQFKGQNRLTMGL